MKNRKAVQRIFIFLFLFTALPAVAFANYSKREDVQEFIDEMVKKHGFDQRMLSYWMERVEQQKSALEAIARPAEAKPWKDYRPIFITSRRISNGVEFWKKHKDILAKAEKHYGVPAEIIVAIIGVETFYGKRIGSYPVFDALTTLGFDYPPRGSFFRKELEQFLLMSREEKKDPRSLKGSYAGAMGMPQFISSSFRAYAVDFDGDGHRDLWNSTADAIGSVANYFTRHGWQPGKPIASRASVVKPMDGLGGKEMKPHTSLAEFKQRGVSPMKPFASDEMATLLKLDGSDGDEYWLGLNNFYVITRYNHSPLYALAVFQLSQAVASEYRTGE
jgi:membrane-bound lytic murein transglycosylase B